MSVAPFVRGDTAVFRFAPEKRMFWADYKGNAIAIDSLARSIRQHKLSIESGDMKVRVLGFCSSYGSCAENLAAAKNRSNQVKSYFIVHEGLKEDHFRTTNSTRQWHGMTDVIGVAYLFRNSETIPASGTLPESGFTSADSVSASQVLKPFVEPDTLIAERSAKPASESTRPIAKALEAAYAADLDLVCISPNAAPPVCKIMDYGKYRFEQAKREKEAKKNQKTVEVKEIRLGLSIDVHDFETKGKHAMRFLDEGNKVKVSIRFRGRELGHPEIGLETMRRFAEYCADHGSVEKAAKMEGRNMLMFLAPKSGK